MISLCSCKRLMVTMVCKFVILDNANFVYVLCRRKVFRKSKLQMIIKLDSVEHCEEFPWSQNYFQDSCMSNTQLLFLIYAWSICYMVFDYLLMKTFFTWVLRNKYQSKLLEIIHARYEEVYFAIIDKICEFFVNL